MADVATYVFDIDSGPARTAAKDLLALTKATTAAAGSFERAEASQSKFVRNAKGQFVSQREVVQKYGASVKELAAEFNPLLAAEIRYEEAMKRLNNAVRAGVVQSAEHANSIRASARAQLDAASAAAQLGQSSKASSHQVANVFSQLNDIGVMMAFQNPFQLALQQGTQLNQVWAQMGGNLKEIGRTLVSAFASMINPVSLLTIGVIAGGAALFQWATSAGEAGDKAKTSSEAVDKLRDAVSRYVSAAQAARATTTSLIGEYGAMAAQARMALDEIAKVDRLEAVKAVAETVGKVFDETVVSAKNVSPYLQGLTADADRLAYGFKLVGQDSKNVLNSLRALGAAKTLDGQAEAAAKVSAALLSAYGSIEKMPPVARQTYAQMQAIAVETAKVTSQTADWADRMSSVRAEVNSIIASISALGGGMLGNAAKQTEIAALKAGKTVKEAARASAEYEIKKRAEVEKASGTWLERRLAGFKETQALIGLQKDAELDALREVANERERQAKKKKKPDQSGARKAAAELKAAEKGFQSFRELMEKESIFQFAEYEKRQKQLDTALAKRLVSQQNYQIMSEQLRTMYFGSDWEVNALQYQMDLDQLNQHFNSKLISEQEYLQKRKELQFQNLMSEQNRSEYAADLSNTAAYFGQLYALSGSSYDRLLKAQQTFQAASALMNAWTGYTQALADPTLPWFMKFAAAGKVLAAGLGAMNAIKGGGKKSAGGGGGTASAPKTDTTKYVTIDLRDANGAFGDFAESIIQQIYEQSKDGRVIINRV